jgi:hypothetical protein
MTISEPSVTPREERADTRNGQVSSGPGSGIPICLVGPGWTFTSGISYYTCRLANAVAESHETSVIQLRRLLPRRLYPGRQRVGLERARMTFRANVSVYNGIDWWWGRSLAGALRFLRARRPGILVLEWWTAAALHTYLVLAIAARAFGISVIIELHELIPAKPGCLSPGITPSGVCACCSGSRADAWFTQNRTGGCSSPVTGP